MWTLDAETRRRYVQGMVRLSVWYVRLLMEQGALGPDELPGALCKRVDLYRLTDMWDGQDEMSSGLADPQWVSMVNTIAGWFANSPMRNVSELEERVFLFLEPSLERRIPRDVGPPPNRPFECWAYELGWPGLADGPGLWGKLSNPAHLGAILRNALGLQMRPSQEGVLHFMNVVVPRSPFADVPRLAETLLELIADLRQRQPQVTRLWCNTWLNDTSRFQALFPRRWSESATISAPGNYRNWWGQFATRNGDFNFAAAEQFRSAGGVFPHRALQCHAPLRDIEAHLKRMSR